MDPVEVVVATGVVVEEDHRWVEEVVDHPWAEEAHQWAAVVVASDRVVGALVAADPCEVDPAETEATGEHDLTRESSL